MYDLTIVGGGPAGVAAAVYAARKKLQTALITKDWGGQSNVSFEIQNWIGTVKISGADFAARLKEHVEAYKGKHVEIIDGVLVASIVRADQNFSVILDDGRKLQTRTILVASGSYRRKLEVPGAAEFDNKGVTYCASCDGPMFSDMDVAVIGGGNAAFETAAQLLAYCKSVTLLIRSDKFRADEVTVQKVLSHPKMRVIKSAVPIEIKGDKFVNALLYKDAKSGEPASLEVKGIFVEIGLVPNTSFIKDLARLNSYNQIVVDPKNQRSSVDGVWAAGDATDGLYHQNNIAAGDAVKALEDIYLYLHTR